MIRAEQVLGERRARRVIARLEGLTRLATFEQVLATVCVLIPLGLIVFDNEGGVRDSISAYYAMYENQWFYVPITVAALLFIVNGVVKKQRFYNWILGAGLLFVVMFDHQGSSAIPHYVGAVIFFAGNGLVMLFYPGSSSERRLRWPLVAIITVAMGAVWFTDLITLFWAEWLSLAGIAAHFFWSSREAQVQTRVTVAP